jgi:hypothetical protein
MGRDTKVVVGGDGHSADSTGGKSSPCIPTGGNLFGCEPCRVTQGSTPDAAATTEGALAWISFNFGSQGSSDPTDGHVYEAVDEETAAVQVVADRHRSPFLAFRGISDGPGDPLPLPGFPVEFFFYQQLAADNAATATAAFIAAWAPPVGAAPTLPALPTAPVTPPTHLPVPAAAHAGRGTAASAVASPTTPPAVLGERVTAEPAPAPTPRVAAAPRRASDGDRSVTGLLIVALLALAAATAGVMRARRRLWSR